MRNRKDEKAKYRRSCRKLRDRIVCRRELCVRMIVGRENDGARARGRQTERRDARGAGQAIGKRNEMESESEEWL